MLLGQNYWNLHSKHVEHDNQTKKKNPESREPSPLTILL